MTAASASWFLDHPWVLVGAGIVLLLVVGTVGIELTERLPRTARPHRWDRPEPWPWGRRWLCRFGAHTAVHVFPEPGACGFEDRCSTCGRVVCTGVKHAYGPEARKDAECRVVAVCMRCGNRATWYRHRTHDVVGADLSLAERREHPPVANECQVVEICSDCGDHSTSWRYEHDFATGRQCARCGDYDEADWD